MTMTADYTETHHPAAVPAVTAMPVRMADASQFIIRGIQRISGMALVIAAVGLWAVPGSSMESDVVLFKLLLTLTAALAGTGLLQASIAQPEVEIEIDVIRREVRVIGRTSGGKAKLIKSDSFAELGGAEIDGAMVRIWDQSGLMLAEVAPLDRTAFSSLVAGLRDEGKLI